MRPTYANRRTNRRETDPIAFRATSAFGFDVSQRRTRPCDRRSTRRIRAKGTAARIIGIKLSICVADCDDFPHRLLTRRRPFPSSAPNHCKRCKSEPQIAADVILKIISRGLTTTRPAFVNEHIFFFLTPTQAFIIQASRPFGFLRDCKDLVQESCRCAKTREAPRDNWLCSILALPSGNSLKVIARPVKTSDASFESAWTRGPATYGRPRSTR